MSKKELGYTTREWMMAFLDMTDGYATWHEIQGRTGLSEERSRELSRMFNKATELGWPED